VALYLEVNEIYSQEVLQASAPTHTASKAFLMDLEFQMLQQAESFLMVTTNGQTQH
jgi:hypothetical protein